MYLKISSFLWSNTKNLIFAKWLQQAARGVTPDEDSPNQEPGARSVLAL